MFKGAISLMTSLEITLISMIVVFSILSILAFVISLFKYIPGEKVEAKVKKTVVAKKVSKEEVTRKAFDPSQIKCEEMRVAMMVASIEAAGEDKDATIKVLGIKEIN
ncbi:OadG family protein [uncultured Cetobacterium sp.]|uniref:OadG family protein n=1 Tax=uncultured Cetobacterium sp. TaxID=527638 RepID=UPI00262DA9C7|nr:OadG family protein [uncultured Cetobacterium sp.]